MTQPTSAGQLESRSISIVIPVYNSADVLHRCLSALQQYAPEGCEILVVDDKSSDESAAVARSFGARVIDLERRQGPAAARNAGAQVVRGSTLVFLDADVCVHEDTIRLLTAPLDDGNSKAVFGSYNAVPAAPQFVSRFRNLLHHYVHQAGNVQASTFWAGCGAIHRKLFMELGGFDPSFKNPSVEDIELGMRLRKAGHRVLLCKQAQVTHFKRWTLWTMCVTDLCSRGIPWSRLILRQRQIPNDLNVRTSQRISVLLTLMLLGLFLLVAWSRPSIVAVPVIYAAALLWIDSARSNGGALACAASLAALLACGAVILTHSSGLFVLGLVGLAATWLMNADFYRLLARCEGRAFAIGAFPLHLLYFLICGSAYAFAVCENLANACLRFRRLRAEPQVLTLTEQELT